MSTVARHNQIYRALFPKPRFGLGGIRAWRADDHLLIVESRALTEYYTRLYWADVQTILLYGLGGHSGVLTAFEIICVLAAIVPLIVWRLPWTFAPAVLFAVFYATWRLTRPSWGCQIITKTNAKRFRIPGTLVAGRQVLNELKNHAASAQGMASEQMTTPRDGVVTTSQLRQGRALRKEPIFAVHVIAFVLGLLSSFHGLFFALYCIMLTVAYFVQQDFEFPPVVRSAAVMNQILAALQLGYWIFATALHLFVTRLPHGHWQFGLSRILASLYGIAAIYWGSVERAKPQRKSSTVLGLN
jgi:hypothetical protein